jgi:predicted small secreted protein
MMRTTILMMLAIAGMGLSACNTVEGAGRDVENAGEAVQDAAN